MSNLVKKERGFTLIEIVLVLAIAGLLLVIVFLAVSGAQRSRRDTQRKNDVSRLAASIENYASNNNGSYPTAAQFPAAAGAGAFGPYVPTNFKDPSSGANYVLVGGAGPGSITYTPSQDCTGAAAGARVYAVSMQLESGTACRDNK